MMGHPVVLIENHLGSMIGCLHLLIYVRREAFVRNKSVIRPSQQYQLRHHHRWTRKEEEAEKSKNPALDEVRKKVFFAVIKLITFHQNYKKD